MNKNIKDENVKDYKNPVINNKYINNQSAKADSYAGQIYEIGFEFEKGVTKYPEGIKFDFSEIGATILMTIDKPTKAEISSISSGNINLALVEIDEILFVLVKFGKGPWQEAPFNINLSQLRTLSGIQEPVEGFGYQLITFLVDSSNGIVEAIRQTGLSYQFSMDFRVAVQKQNKMSFNREVYERKIDRVWSTYKQGDLLRSANKIYMYRKNEWVVGGD